MDKKDKDFVRRMEFAVAVVLAVGLLAVAAFDPILAFGMAVFLLIVVHFLVRPISYSQEKKPMNRKLTPLQQIVAVVVFLAIAFVIGDQMWKAVDPDGHRAFWGGNDEVIVPEVQATEEFEQAATEIEQDAQRVYSGLVCKDTDHDTYCSYGEDPFLDATLTVMFIDGDEMTFAPNEDGRWTLVTNRQVDDVTVGVSASCESWSVRDYRDDGSFNDATAVLCPQATPTPTSDPVPEWERLSPYADALDYEGQIVRLIRVEFVFDQWAYETATIETEDGMVTVGISQVYAIEWYDEDGLTYKGSHADLPISGELVVYTNKDPEYDFLDSGEQIIEVIPPQPPLTEKDKRVEAVWPSFVRQVENTSNLVSISADGQQWSTLYGSSYDRCSYMGVVAYEMPWISGIPQFCIRRPVEFALTSMQERFHYTFWQPPAAYRVMSCGVRSHEYVLDLAGQADYELWGDLTYKYPYLFVFRSQKTGESVELKIPGGGYLAVLDPAYIGWVDTPPEAWEWFYVPTNLDCKAN